MASPFLLAVVGCCSLLGLVSAVDDCSTAPLWLFSNPEDIRSIFPIITEALVLVDDGVPMEVLTSREFATSSLIVFEDVDEIPVIWCIQSSEYQEIHYSLSLVSDDITIAEVSTSILSQGTIINAPLRWRLIFRCLPSEDRRTTGITVTLLTNTSTGVEFCPIQFFFGKRCIGEGSTYSSGEGPTALQNLGITDGYLNNTNITVKSTDIPATRIVTIAGESVAPKALMGVFIPLGIITLIAIIIATLLGMTWYRRSKTAVAEFNLEAVSNAYKDLYILGEMDRGKHEKEFPLEHLKIIRELGEGAFGVVSQAQAEGIVEGEGLTDVAVKQLREGSHEFEEFFREVDFMSGLDHPNIVRLLGVCSQKEPYSMIFEYMDLGDLRSFLRDAIGLGKDLEDEAEEGEEGEEVAPTEPMLTKEELLRIVLQVSQGMEYISSRHLVHRDLAARNCLVATGLLVKIADFGMSRNVDTTDYYRVKGSAILPIRWMPPESVLYGKFTVESDIWAFGILLWEVFTFGQQPYFGLQNEEVILNIKDGKHPDPPPDCPALWLMLHCWNRNPKKRPSFEECGKQIQQLIDDMS